MREFEDPPKRAEEDSPPTPANIPSALDLFRESPTVRSTPTTSDRSLTTSTSSTVSDTSTGGSGIPWWRSDYKVPGLTVVGADSPVIPVSRTAGKPDAGAPRGGAETAGVATERPGGMSDRAGKIIHLPPDVSKMIPECMKYGAAYNPWHRVTDDEFASVTKGLESLMSKAGRATPAKEERGKDGTVTKRDASGRVITHEDPAKNTRVHLVYEGTSKEASAAVIEKTDTGHKIAMKIVDTSKSGAKEIVALTSTGEKKHIIGEIGTGPDGKFHAHLTLVKPPSLDGKDDRKSDVRPGGKDDRKTDVRPDGKDGRKTETKPDTELTSARDSLKRTVGKFISNPVERAEYLRDMEKFEAAAKKAGLSSKEVADFYKQSNRLLRGPSDHVSQTGRVRIAMEGLKHAIDPTTIKQGFFKTCNTSTVQVAMFMREPSKAMKAITDAALTGKFTTADGTTIKMPPKTLEAPPKDSTRSFASQIFQELAINAKWQRASVGPGGTPCAPGDLRYTHGFPVTDAKKDTGQRIYRESDGAIVTRVEKDKKVKEVNSPTVALQDLPDIYKQIAGKSPALLGISVEKPGVKAVDGIKTVGSEKELHDELTRLSSTKGGFPLILKVHTGHEPWYTNSGAGKEGGAGGWHVVTITGYDPVNKRVSIDNTWNDSVDHLPGRAGAIPLAAVYKSMHEAPPRPAVRPTLRR